MPGRIDAVPLFDVQPENDNTVAFRVECTYEDLSGWAHTSVLRYKSGAFLKPGNAEVTSVEVV